MADAGIFKADDRVELIEGEIVEMSPIGSLHSECVEELNTLLRAALRDKPFKVRSQNPVHLGEHTEPQPDLAVVRAQSYRTDHPTVADIALLIEVADASLMYDRRTKTPLYLRFGVPEVWLVDLINHTIEVHTPAGVQRFRAGESVVSSVLPELQIAVDELPI